MSVRQTPPPDTPSPEPALRGTTVRVCHKCDRAGGRVVRRPGEGGDARLGGVFPWAVLPPFLAVGQEDTTAPNAPCICAGDPSECRLRALHDGRWNGRRGIGPRGRAVRLVTGGRPFTRGRLLRTRTGQAGPELELVPAGRLPGQEDQRQSERTREQQQRCRHDAHACSCHRLSPWLLSRPRCGAAVRLLAHVRDSLPCVVPQDLPTGRDAPLDRLASLCRVAYMPL